MQNFISTPVLREWEKKRFNVCTISFRVHRANQVRFAQTVGQRGCSQVKQN
jgi:hypothetical protein